MQQFGWYRGYYRPKHILFGAFFIGGFMKNIIFSDVTLSLYSQVDGFNLSFKEKLETARRLQELNVDCIEVCANNSDVADDVLIKTISAVVNKTVIACRVGNSIEDIEKNYSLVSSAKYKRLVVVVPVSAVLMEYYVSKKPKAVLELLGELTKKAKSLCKDVEVVLEDATRAEQAFLLLAISTALENGANIITLSDVAGNTTPLELYDFITNVRQNVPEILNAKLFVQCSDKFSMATANAISSLIAGADGIKTSALPLGIVPSIEKVVSAIEAVSSKNAFAYSINKTAINRIIKQIQQVSAIKSGVLINADYVAEEVIDSNVAYADFVKLIKKRGYDLSVEDYKKVYADFVKLASKKSVNYKELDVMISTTALSVPETYSLLKYSIHSSNVLNTTADIVLKKDNQELSGLSYGDGSVEAAFFALEKIVGRHFELDDFELGAVTEGKEAVGQAIVKLRANGKIYAGRGISTDILGASIKAYINAVNKIVYEEKQ